MFDSLWSDVARLFKLVPDLQRGAFFFQVLSEMRANWDRFLDGTVSWLEHVVEQYV